jgi:hypothetical protein
VLLTSSKNNKKPERLELTNAVTFISVKLSMGDTLELTLRFLDCFHFFHGNSGVNEVAFAKQTWLIIKV